MALYVIHEFICSLEDLCMKVADLLVTVHHTIINE